MEDEYLTLIEAINSSDADKTYTLNENEVVSANLGILQGNTLTINGEGHTISTENSNQGVYVFIGQTLNVSNVSDWIGFDRQLGGVFNNEGTIIINSSDFTNNKAQHGSVIYNEPTGVIEADNIKFENNSRSPGLIGSNYAYGTIYNEGEVTLTNVDFIRNDMGAAGAFYNVGTATITKANFIENSARVGGTILADEGSMLTIREAVFDANSGGNVGAAAVRLNNGSVSIYDSIFRNHYEVVEDPEDPYYDRQNGGVIYQYDSGYAYDDEGNPIGFVTEPGMLHIENTSFINNVVSRGGGAIYANGKIKLINVIFQENKSDVTQGENSAGTGGAFYSYNRTNYFYDDTFCVIDGCSFIANTAYTAGAIYHAIGRLDILNTRFERNQALQSRGFGGCFFTQSGTLVNLTNVDFVNNASLGSGGVIGTEAGSFNIDDCLFDGNTSATGGAVLMTHTDDELSGDTPEINITNSRFVNNSGSSILTNSYILNVSNCEFNENSGIAIDNDNTLYVGNVSITNNTGISIQGSGTINILNTTIKNGTETAINILKDPYYGNDGNCFVDNLHVEGTVANITNPYSFSGNVHNASIAIIKNSSFLNNKGSNTGSGVYGGAVLCLDNTTFVADNGDSVFTGNSYNNTSSAICIVQSETPTNIYAGTNESTSGRFIFNDSICIEPNAILNINSTNTENYPTNGVVQINDSVRLAGNTPYGSRATVNMNNGIVQFGNATVDYGEGEIQSFGSMDDSINFNVNGGVISTIDDAIGETNLGRLVLNSNVTFQLDVNLSNSTCDTLTYESFTANSNNIIIDEINIIANGEEGEINIQITDDINLRNVIRFSDNVRFTTSSGIFGRYEMTNYNSSTGVLTINYTYMEELFEINFNGNWVGSEWTLANITYYDVDGNVTTQTSLATHYRLADGVTEIGLTAFLNCQQLVSISVSNVITSLADGAFVSCLNLESIILSNNLINIGQAVFVNCFSLAAIDIPASVESIEDAAFEMTLFSPTVKLANINVHIDNANYSSIDGVLYNKDATTIITYPAAKEGSEYTIIDTVTNIGLACFGFARNLTSIIIPNSVTSIEERAFYNIRSLTTISIPNTITRIENNTFKGCSGLISVNIPNSVTSIGAEVFDECAGLVTITIPNSVTSIGNNVLRGATSLTQISVEPFTQAAAYELADVLRVSNSELLTYVRPSVLAEPIVYSKGVLFGGGKSFGQDIRKLYNLGRLVWTAPNLLPYRELGAIQSDGTQFINLGFNANVATDEVILTFAWVDATAQDREIVLGSSSIFSLGQNYEQWFRDNSSDEYFNIIISTPESVREIPTTILKTDTNYNTISLDKDTIKVNNIIVSDVPASLTPSTQGLPLHVFGVDGYNTSIKLKELIINRNGSAFRHYKPVVLLEKVSYHPAGTIGLWDMVNDVFITTNDSESNPFIAIEKDPSWQDYGERGEYIENTANSYIDLGYTPSIAGRTHIVVSSNTATNDTKGIFGFIDRVTNINNRISIGYTVQNWFVGAGNTTNIGTATQYDIVDIVWNRQTQQCIANGVAYPVPNAVVNVYYPAYLFNRNTGNGVDADIYAFNGKIYVVEEREDGNINLSLIPLHLTKQPITDAGGRVHNIGDWVMYDTVNNTVPAHYGTFTGAVAESGDIVTYGSNNDIVTYGTNNDTVIY